MTNFDVRRLGGDRGVEDRTEVRVDAARLITIPQPESIADVSGLRRQEFRGRKYWAGARPANSDWDRSTCKLKGSAAGDMMALTDRVAIVMDGNNTLVLVR
jgi:hypothetical protein